MGKVITKYKSMFKEMTKENSEEYLIYDLAQMDLDQLQELKAIYQGFGFLGEAIDVIDDRIKELQKS